MTKHRSHARFAGAPGAPRAPGGFSLVEMAMTLMLVSVLLVAALTTVGASRKNQAGIDGQRHASGLAETLLAEMVAQPYADPAAGPDSFGRSIWEDAPGNRSRFDDVDDYHGWSASPPEQKDGQVIPDLARWGRAVSVDWVDPDALENKVISNMGVKRITVTVTHDGLPFTSLYAYRTQGLPEPLGNLLFHWRLDDGPGDVVTAGLAARWRLDEGTGTSAADEIGGRDAFLSNPLWTTGPLAGALSFDGIDDYGSVAHDIAIAPTSALTLAAWIYKHSSIGIDPVFNKGNSQSNLSYWLATKDRELIFGFLGDEFPTIGLGLQDTRWYHVAATFDDLADEVVIYVDGLPALTTTTTQTPLPRSADLLIGSGLGQRWDGRLDDLRLYNRALLPKEAETLALGPPCTVLDAPFDTDDEGWTYADDVFGTNSAPYATGRHEPAGYLKVELGPGPVPSQASSGGWSRTITIPPGGRDVTIALAFRLVASSEYESTEVAATIIEVDGTRVGNGPNGTLAEFTGDGNGGPNMDTGWRTETFRMFLGAGDHDLVMGAHNNNATYSNEWTDAFFDDVLVTMSTITGTAAEETAAHDGTFVGCLAEGGAGYGDGGTAIRFAGGHVEVPHDDTMMLDEGTFAFWFKADDLLGRQGLVTKDAIGYGTGGHLQIRTDGSRLSTTLESTNWTSEVRSGYALSAGQWHHAVFTFGPDGMSLYLDGAPVDTSGYTGGLAGNSEPLVIGADTSATSPGTATPTDDPFLGVIDDVRIYDAPISASAVTALFQEGSP